MTSATTTALAPVSRKFPLPCWTHDETLALIDTYRDRWIALRRGYLRTADWEAVAYTVGEKCGHAVTPTKSSDQCRHKMEKLRQRYRAEKQRCIAFPGKFFSAWIFFKALSFLDDGCSAQSKKRVAEEKAADDPVPESFPGDRDEGFFLTALGDRKFTIDLKNFVKINDKIQNPSFGVRRDIPFPPENILEPRMKKLARTEIDSGINERFNFDDDLQKGFVRSRPDLIFDVDKEGGFNFSGGVTGKLHSSMKYVNKPKIAKNNHMNTNRVEHQDEGDLGVEMDPLAEMAESIKLLGDGFLKMEKMRMEMALEFEKARMEVELKRNEMIMESQRRIVEVFTKAAQRKKAEK
ncbi:unnamed protein product [Rhodiola kirilowii]